MTARSFLPALSLMLAAYPGGAQPLELKTAGTLRVLAVEGSPQFVNLTPGGRPGFDREVLEGFARVHKLSIELVPVSSWDQLLGALVEGRGDLVAGGVTMTAARQRLVDFTAEIFPTRLVVMTRKPHRVVANLKELREERVGTIRGTSMAEVLAQAAIPAHNLDDSFRSGGLPEGLRAGRITASVIGVEDAVIEQRSDPRIQLGMFLGPRGSLAFAVRKDGPQLRSALDTFIETLRHSPAWSRLVVKYFGDAALDVLRRAQDTAEVSPAG